MRDLEFEAMVEPFRRKVGGDDLKKELGFWVDLVCFLLAHQSRVGTGQTDVSEWQSNA